MTTGWDWGKGRLLNAPATGSEASWGAWRLLGGGSGQRLGVQTGWRQKFVQHHREIRCWLGLHHAPVQLPSLILPRPHGPTDERHLGEANPGRCRRFRQRSQCTPPGWGGLIPEACPHPSGQPWPFFPFRLLTPRHSAPKPAQPMEAKDGLSPFKSLRGWRGGALPRSVRGRLRSDSPGCLPG